MDEREYDDTWKIVTDGDGNEFWINRDTDQVFETDMSVIPGAFPNGTLGAEVTEDFYEEHPEEDNR